VPDTVININSNNAPCPNCGVNLLDIKNFIFNGKVDNMPTYIEEYCSCRHCGAPFILHYDLFDSKGHIFSRVFTEDINNMAYNWQDSLTDEQKKMISGHLEGCNICLDRLSHEILTDAWLKSFIASLRKKAL